LSRVTAHACSGITVWVHDAAVDEADRCGWNAEGAAHAVAAAFRKGLHRTAGTTLRTLSRQDSNREYRFRRGSLRVVCTHTRDSRGEPVLALHAVRPRGVVYREDAFEARLDAFYERAWDLERGEARPGLETGYHAVTVKPEEASEAELDDVQCVPLLTDAQFACLDDLLPFPNEFGGEHAFLLLGYGPPGCGKTLVAQEAAIAAHVHCGYHVLVLAPSEDILARVARYAADQGVVASREVAVPGAADLAPVFRVAEVREFLRHAAGETTAAISREAALFQWWRAVQEVPALRPWMNVHAVARSPVFARLIDALWNVPETYWARAKDGLSAQYGEMLGLLVELRSSVKRAAMLDDFRKAAGLRFRCEIAQEASLALRQSVEVPSPVERQPHRLLVLVDECQDLVPAEWQSLITWCAARMAHGAPTRLALLGDENQRITPTAFAWSAVRDHARHVQRLPDERVKDRLIERRSFRLPPVVARTARLIFDGSLLEVRGTRQAAYASDDEDNGRHGRVEFHVIPDAVTNTLRAAAAVGGRLDGDARLTVVLPEEAEMSSPTASRVDIMRPRRVKGLEYERVVVVSPFAPVVARKAERLLYDEATVAYTVLTRSSCDLLCVVTPVEWRLLAPIHQRLSAAGVVVHEHDGLSRGSRAYDLLADAVADFSEDVSRELRVERLARQLAGVATEMDEVGTGVTVERVVGEILELAYALVALDEVMRVVALGGELLLRHPWLGSSLRGRADSLHADGQAIEAAVALLLLGETAGAAEAVLSLANGDDESAGRRLHNLILPCLAGWQRRLYGERRSNALTPTAPGALLTKALLLRETAAAFANTEL
jgi:hypothetical protein